MTKVKKNSIAAQRVRIQACALAVMLCFGLVCGTASTAFAEVRKADIVTGMTVESRALTIAQCPNVDASYIYVIDSEGTVFFERDSNVQTQIASVTKVMTCLVALDYGKDTDKITVSADAADIGESSANLMEGDVVAFQDMLKALMVPSGNDAALSLAEYYGAQIIAEKGGGDTSSQACVDAFVAKMNEKAAALGMNDTVFTNPHGLDDGIYESNLHSTAHDVGQMALYAMKDSRFRAVCGIDGCSIVVQRGENPEDLAEIDLEPTDEILDTYEGALGIKTGFTNKAGACFAGASTQKGHEVYAIILDAPDEQTRFTDAETCMDWVYENFVSYPLVNSSQKVTMSTDKGQADVPVVAYAAHSGWVNCTIPVTLEDPKQTVEVFRLSGNVMQDVILDDITGDIKAGQKVGVINYYQHNNLIASANLVACVDQSGPNLFQSIGVSFDRFMRGFNGEQTVAKTEVVNTTPILMDRKQ